MISGLQKMTLLDYPGKVACTVFLQGCNFRCPFCHNSDLLPARGEQLMDLAELLSFLKKRIGLLDAVCISGGEPTLDPELESMLREIKAMGYLTKLDTNGSRPDVLKQLMEQELLDYVAMDIKNGPSRYAETSGLPQLRLSVLEDSLHCLLTGKTEYELRTTLVEELHDEASIQDMGLWLHALSAPLQFGKLYLQSFVDRDSVVFAGLSAPEDKKICRYAEILSAYVQEVRIRNL